MFNPTEVRLTVCSPLNLTDDFYVSSHSTQLMNKDPRAGEGPFGVKPELGEQTEA